ncbi:MAG: hypothetical protein ACRC4T_08135 [Cetobacterium sp.]
MNNEAIIEILAVSLEGIDITLEAKEKISLEFLKNLTEVNHGRNNSGVRKSQAR